MIFHTFFNKYITILSILLLSLGISACDNQSNSQKDLFDTLDTKQMITLDGEIRPFSVSIATSATHRLANIDGKLIAYLYSDIVDLSQFESRIVEIDGFWQNEKMQEIFYVEAIRIQDLEEDSLNISEEQTEPQRFSTKSFTFTYPSNWTYSLSPVGVSHFVDKNDPERRVFLIFSTQQVTKKDLSQEPNISISGMKGFRTITDDKGLNEKQEINLLSNIFDKKYTFTFSGTSEQKKNLLLLTNSFIEGKDAVISVIEKEKKILAEREASKLKKEIKNTEVVLEEEPQTKLSDTNISKTDSPVTNNSESPITDVTDLAKKYTESTKETTIPTNLSNDFKNVVDGKAFQYTSDYYNLKLKVPYGFWFQNFGPDDFTLFRIGFSTEEIGSISDPKFWLKGLSSEKPVSEFTERIEDERLIIEFPRTNTSYFQFSGDIEYRDAMRSILLTIE